jgi:uncharacterized membrane protein
MDYYLIFLRLIHISCGVFWAGVSIYLAAYILPATKRAGPAGGKFMQELSMTNKLPLVMTIIPTLVVISGLLLLWSWSQGLKPELLGTAHGIVLQSGITAALISYIIGFSVNRPAIVGITKIGQSLAGSPPNEEQAAMLAKLRGKLTTGTNIIAWLLGITVMLMSIVRQF